MTYRVESNGALISPFVAHMGAHSLLLSSLALAIVTAAKSRTSPMGGEIRVVHEPSGKVVFSKVSEPPADEDL